jgi:choice-of-anchor B domain-containing protein
MLTRSARAVRLATLVGALALAVPVPRAAAHDGNSALATWGDLGAATPCQRAVAAATERCIDAALAAPSACLEAAADGPRCDPQATVVAARQAALDAIELACQPADAPALTRTDLAALLADAVRGCRDVTDLLATLQAPPAAAGDRCARAQADAVSRLGRYAVRTWRRTFDHIAARPLPVPTKDALAAAGAARIGRVHRLLAARVAAACAPQPAVAVERSLAEAAEAGRCFAGEVYAQEAVTCARATASAVVQGACNGGFASTYPCRNVDLAAFLPLSALGGGSSNDVWGWTDPQTDTEYALLGRSSGMSVVDIGTPTAPVYLGNLPTHTTNSTWRGIKVYADHAFVVSEAGGHGMQVFDLRQVRDLTTVPVTFTETAHYPGFGNSHTIAVNEASGFVYAAGTNTCSGGLHMIDVRTPAAPQFAGCVAGDGYTHETQCVTYHGPDTAYVGRELCFSSNTDTLTVIDVTNKSTPVQVSRTTYAGRGYTHQGWLTEDHRYLLMDDETDEQSFGHNTRTYIWDVGDVNAPAVIGSYYGPVGAIDHNLYIRGGHAFQANYRSGLRVLDLANVAGAALHEVGFFDIYPANDSQGFNGAWSNYPFFDSGVVLVSGIEQGLYVLEPQLGVAVDTPTPTPTMTATPTRTGTPTRTPTPVVGMPTITAPSAGQTITTSGVTFAWTAVAAATGYDLRILNGGGGTVFSGSLSGNAATSTLISLPQAGSYTFRVRACIGGGFTDGQCGFFAARSFSVAIGAPSTAPTVTGPAAGANLTQSIVTLTWTGITGSGPLPLFYEVDLTETGGNQRELQILLPDTSSSTVTRIHTGSYALRVRACQGGCGPWSATRTFTATIGAPPSTAPMITSAVVGGGNSLAVSWSVVGGAEWYQLYVIQPPPAGPGGGALTVAAREVVGTSLGSLPIPTGAASVLVAACTGNGCGPFSGATPITGGGPNPSAPQLGQPLGGSVVNGPGVLFTWSRIPGDNGSNTVYRLYVQDLSRATAALDVQTTDNFYGAYFKAEGARYDALVVANPGPAQVVGPAVGFVVAGPSATAPTMAQPTHNSSLAQGNIQLGWSPVPGATLYEYFVAAVGASIAPTRGVTPGLVVQVPLTALGGMPQLYSGIVRACPAAATCAPGSDAGWGPWSNEAGPGVTNFTITPPPIPPGGSSLRFFGTGSGDVDRVKIALDDPPRPADVGAAFTLELWMKTAAGNASGSCVAGGDGWINGNIVVDRDVFGAGDAGDYGLSLFGTGGRLAFGVAVGNAGHTICGTRNVADGAWHHVAATRAADGALALYVDGQLDASGSGPAGDIAYTDDRPTSWPSSDPFLVLGAEKHDAGAAFPSYHGWLDELRLSTSVRYTAAFTRPSAPFASDAATAGLWHFDEGNSDTVFDSSGASGGPSDGERRVGGAANGPQWSTDIPFASQAPAITLEPLFTSGLAGAPTAMAHAGDARLFITEQTGGIRIWDGSQLVPTPFLTIAPIGCCGEQGLLGLAFHPDYATNGFFYVNYTNPSGDTVIARYRRSAGDADLADPNSGVVLRTIGQPADNHNGGALVFGPDGYLYVGMGDGGGSCDDAGAGCAAQNDNTLLGKMLRLDVDQNVATPPYYGIPADNPFVGAGDPPDEVWARGLRNPWRNTFDALTGGLFIADVGQGTREEVNLVAAGTPGGMNFGWKVMEGTVCNTCSLTNCPAIPACNSPALTLPITEYSHAGGNCSITGGYAYRGTRVPNLYGKYVFGDLCSGRLWWAAQNNGSWTSTAFTTTAGGLYTFGEGMDGELYVGQGSGTVSRIR